METPLSSPSLLQKIDQLREKNIGQHVPLPQLVVVGDQSSGKSSLLESLTGIPFPTGQGLCTRYATQITSRRDSERRVEVRILPGPNASDAEKQALESFFQSLPPDQDIRGKFSQILQKVNEKMGIVSDREPSDGSLFSQHVLKIEIRGPQKDYLTIIDVPGIFRTPEPGFTTKKDIDMVNSLVKRYIKDDRTIILAVLPSTADIATQEILRLATDHDKQGERTLAILTKPDLVTERSAQGVVCDLVRGNRHQLTLGYYLVRNRGPDDDKAVSQSELEKTFTEEPWCDLPPDRLGVEALMTQLRTLLDEIAWREFPKLQRDFNEQMKGCQKELDSFGPTRTTQREQQSFLSTIARDFQDRVRSALAADYVNGVFSKDELRLITHVVNITDVFSEKFHHGAHQRRFEDTELSSDDESIAEEYTPPAVRRISDEEEEGSVDTSQRSQNDMLDDITREEYEELIDIIALDDEPGPPENNIMIWIRDLYERSRGMDLGTFNSHLLSLSFSEQSRKWKPLTKIYMGKVILTIHRFMSELIRSVCPDEKVSNKIWGAILGSVQQRYRKAVDQAMLLVDVEQCKRPYTLNRLFNDAIQQARGQRIKELVRPRARKDSKQYGSTQHMISLDDIPRATQSKENSEQMQEEIHDALHAYYNLALSRFIDNVFQLAVDHGLLTGADSPLLVFSQEWVINLEPTQLEAIASETKATKLRRKKLNKKLEDLSSAINILKS